MTIKKFIYAFGILGSLTAWGAGDLSTILEAEGSAISEEEAIEISTLNILYCETALDEKIKKQAYLYATLCEKTVQLIAQIEEADDYLKPKPSKSRKSSKLKQRQLSAKERNKWIKWRTQDLQNFINLEGSIKKSSYTINELLDDCWDSYNSAIESKDDYTTYNRGVDFYLKLKGLLKSYRKTLERLQQ